MSSALKWIVGLSVSVAMSASIVSGCSSKKGDLNGNDVANGGDGGDNGGSSGFGVDNGGSSGFSGGASSSSGSTNTGPCKGGKYDGTFAGLYTSHLTGVGVPIPVTGNVDLTLNQEGTAGQQCMIEGEFARCSDVFSLQDGTITGVADGTTAGDATVGGFPYYCTMTGTLDCPNKKLVDGWIQCTYCVGPLADAGTSCSLFNGVGGTTGVGGHFAGPLIANYDYGSFSFVMGSWNGAEALAGNNGMQPTPDGGPISDYLSDSGLYLGPNDFGGSGTWNATYH